ncbi:MAG: hypothetical protein AB1938_26040, partial [Myxococcota bacterium]
MLRTQGRKRAHAAREQAVERGVADEREVLRGREERRSSFEGAAYIAGSRGRPMATEGAADIAG